MFPPVGRIKLAALCVNVGTGSASCAPSLILLLIPFAATSTHDCVGASDSYVSPTEAPIATIAVADRSVPVPILLLRPPSGHEQSHLQRRVPCLRPS